MIQQTCNNADETLLLQQTLLNRTLALKGERCHDRKHRKLCIPVLLCTIMNRGSRHVPLVNGRRKKLWYSGIHSSWKWSMLGTESMKTRNIFRGWLRTFDANMKTAGRKVCAILDNCFAHQIEDSEHSYVEVKFLPLICTLLIQQLDQSMNCAYLLWHIDKLLPQLCEIIRLREMSRPGGSNGNTSSGGN